MSARDRMLLKFIVPVALAAALWLLILSPKVDDMKAAQTEVDSANAALTQANVHLTEVRVNQKSIRQQRKRLEAASRAVPASLAIPSLLRQLERTARTSGVGLDTITQGGGDEASPAVVAAQSAGVDATGVSLTLAGRYRNVRRFLARLDNLVKVSSQTVSGTGRLVSLSTISATPDDGDKRLTVTVQATVYTLKPATTLATAGAAPAGTTPTAPASASAPVTSAAVTPGG